MENAMIEFVQCSVHERVLFFGVIGWRFEISFCVMIRIFTISIRCCSVACATSGTRIEPNFVTSDSAGTQLDQSPENYEAIIYVIIMMLLVTSPLC